MSLSVKVKSLNSETVVQELDQLLVGVKVQIGRWGQRLVSVEAYKGWVKIDHVASAYLKAKPFKDHTCRLKERLDCDALWDRVSQLYTASDALLKTMPIYGKIVPLLEYRPYSRLYAGDPQVLMDEDPNSNCRMELFYFTPDTFKQLFENADPRGSTGSGGVVFLGADRAMVETAYEKTMGA